MLGQIQNVSQAGVLIADDSPLVVANLKILLRESGFSDRLIFTAKDIRSVYKNLREISIDLFICDYRFGKELNGKQILEECRHYGLIRPQCAVIMLTSETTGEVVRSILEAEPDEYVLKPYSLYEFKKRVLRVYRRKQTLSALLKQPKNASYQDIAESFKAALKAYPEYTAHIQRLQGVTYLERQFHTQAIEHYDSCSTLRKSHWAIVGKASALLEMGEVKQAHSLLEHWIEESGRVPSSVSDMLALTSLVQRNSTSAKNALTDAIKFSKGSAPRLLAYIRLCEIEENYDGALSGLAIYRHQIANTHRNTVANAIHLMRLKLVAASAQGKSISMVAHKELHNLMKSDLAESEILALTLVDVHIELHDENYKVARIKLANLLKNYQQLQLPQLHYLLYLLFVTDNYHWFDQVAGFARSHTDYSKVSLSACSMQMQLEHQIVHGMRRKSALVRLLAQVDEYSLQSVEKAVALGLEIFKSRKQCVLVANKMLSLLNREIPRAINPAEIRKVIFDCEAAITCTSSLRKTERIDAQKKLNLVKLNFNRALAAV
ncbi:response regulator [Vibrio coralliilyticus]|uniref:response regulator n=1 Tax=Vibrio coralliilyticus TaxID=190893 RepID=UPI000BAB1C54|nr:response regulator [Vibrio coralliilyticus]NOI56061.1 response regulator [Vibrio coralliilyticus]PAT69404.1 response regulator [Vibrio coralliilyticus]